MYNGINVQESSFPHKTRLHGMFAIITSPLVVVGLFKVLIFWSSHVVLVLYKLVCYIKQCIALV